MRVAKSLWGRGLTLLLALAVGAGVLGGCALGNRKTKLVVGLFGEFGYEDLYTEYEKAHPDVDIVQQRGDVVAHHKTLEEWLRQGTGAPDVAAIEESYVVGFRGRPETFVDFNTQGVDPKTWLDWKWRQSLSDDGRQIGLGTDVGGLAMCYRRDLFEDAGLPTAREQVSALWPTWDDYIGVGQRFNQAGTGKKFVDAATNTYNTILMQQGDTTYYARDNRFVMPTNPGVRTAWEYTMRMIQADLSANLVAFQTSWNRGMADGEFATVACPAWMMGYIKQHAGKGGAGKWDVATVPGGQGNWGGSFLTVPKQGKHLRAAVELAKWLTAPEQQIRTFSKAGNMPSTPAVYDDPRVRDFTDPYFNDAPVGKIFTDGARGLRPVYLGPRNGDVRAAVENVIRDVERGHTDTGDGWPKAVVKATEVNAR